jgi:uncharacterized protein HemX
MQGKSPVGKVSGSRSGQTPVECSASAAKRRTTENIGTYFGIGAALVAVAALIIAVLAYVNQRDANQAASLAALQQYASKVSYVLARRRLRPSRLAVLPA